MYFKYSEENDPNKELHENEHGSVTQARTVYLWFSLKGHPTWEIHSHEYARVTQV